MGEKIHILLGAELLEHARSFPDRSRETTLPPREVWVERKRAGFSAWYEFFPRSFSRTPGAHGTFDEAQDMLAEIAALGFNIVYLPPIHPIGRTNRKGRNNTLEATPADVGSPWAIGSEKGGHKAVHPALGTLESFRKFVWKAGELGMEVALDIAFQCSPDHPYVRRTPRVVQVAPRRQRPVRGKSAETIRGHHPLRLRVRDLARIVGGAEIRPRPLDRLRSAGVSYRQSPYEALRLLAVGDPGDQDPASGRALPERGLHATEIEIPPRQSRLHPRVHLFHLAEHEGRAGVLPAGTLRPARKSVFWPNFWPNTPDILAESLQYGGRPAFGQRLVLAATLSSNYGMYGPAYEQCVHESYPGKEEYDHSEKYEIKTWNLDAPGNLRPLIRRLNHIRRDHPALQRTFNLRFVDIDNPQMIAYLKQDPSGLDIILTIVSLDPYHEQTAWVTLPLGDYGIDDSHPFLVQDLLPETDQSDMPRANYLWNGPRNFVKLHPEVCPAHIFRIFRKQRKEEDFDYWL